MKAIAIFCEWKLVQDSQKLLDYQLHIQMDRVKVNVQFWFEGRQFHAYGYVVWEGWTKTWNTLPEHCPGRGRDYFEVKSSGSVYLGWTFSSQGKGAGKGG